MSLGDLQGSYAARRAALEHAERHGLLWYIRWLRIQELPELYFTRGDWDRLLALADEFVRERTILATPAYDLRIRVRLARGDVDGAVGDAEQVLALATRAGDRQALLPALSIAAFAKLAAGDRIGCAALADDLLESAIWSSVWSHFYAAPLLGVVLHALGRGDELATKTAAWVPGPSGSRPASRPPRGTSRARPRSTSESATVPTKRSQGSRSPSS